MPKQFFRKNRNFHNNQKELSNIWTTFVREFITNTFQKYPNLVKLLIVDNGVRLSKHSYDKVFRIQKFCGKFTNFLSAKL